MSKRYCKANKKSVSNPKILEVRKTNLILIPNTKDYSEEEMREIAAMIDRENAEIKKKYFSVNTPIIEAQQRTFRDLVKIFISCIMKS